MVSVFAPAVAARRQHARNLYEHGVQRTYDASRRDRTNSNWRPLNQSADLELMLGADEMRARARDLAQNNAYARGILSALERNVIGCGIKPQSRVDNDAFAEQVEKDFANWQRRADVTGRLSFYAMQSLIYREVKEAGECLVRFIESPDRRRVVPLALEMIEADRFATDHFIRGVNPATGREVRRGVELSASGEPVAYWLYTAHPNGVNSWRQQAESFDASEFVHLFKQERIGQTRGVTAFAPVMLHMRNLGFYIENELQSSAIASCLSVAIKTMGGEADGGLPTATGADSVDDNGATFDHVEPGMIGRLFPGEDIEVINPSRGHADSAVFIDLMVRSMAIGTGLSYERLSRDYSKTNYSSNRASDLEDRRAFRPEQDWMINALCRPVWERFLNAAVATGREGYPDAAGYVRDFDEWSNHVWNPPGWEWVDPAKEQKASAEAISTNLSTLEDEHGKRGKDWKDVLTQRKREKDMITELGLDAPSPSELLAAESQEQETVDAEA